MRRMPGGWAAISADWRGCGKPCARASAEIHAASGRKVSLVGWSLGGVYARDLALQAPDMVRSVITLGSPFANDVRATNATALYEAMSGERVEDFAEAARGDRRRSSGAGDVDLFAHRRRRELADLPAAPLRPRREHRGAFRKPYRARGEPRRACGPWRIAWRNRRGSSGHLTGPGRLPLHMPRRSGQYRPDEKRQQRRPSKY